MLPKAPKSLWSPCLPCMNFFFLVIASKSNKREKDKDRDLKVFFFNYFFIFFNLISFLLILKNKIK